MGLFDKKYCDVCGDRIRFLGNRKLEDGNLCKECESKLSPWFSDRRKSTVREIKEQLAYREENKRKVADFATKRTLGEGNLLLIDEQNGQFLIRRNGAPLSDNPDVISFADVTGCETEVEHSKLEQKTKNEEGKMVSYDPPRFTYSYRFYLKIYVKNPWFDEMRFRVNRSNVEIETGIPIEAPADAALAGLLGLKPPEAAYVTEPDTDNCEAYQKYAAMSEEMRRAVLCLPEEVPEAPEPVTYTEKVACPFCTAVAVPDALGRCPYCGEKVVG